MNTTGARTRGAARAKKSLEKALTGTAVIYRFLLSSDGRGGETMAWTDLGDTVACHIEPYARKPSETADDDVKKIESENEFIGHFKRGTNISPKDRVVSDSATYEVTGVDLKSTLGPIIWTYLFRVQ